MAMVEVLTKPAAKQATDAAADTDDNVLVTDHGIEGLVLNREEEAGHLCYTGTLQVGPRQIGFEGRFKIGDDWSNKAAVRAVLVESAVYTDDGSNAARHIAMNAKFKALIKRIQADLAPPQAS